jgi:hypothetical protein
MNALTFAKKCGLPQIRKVPQSHPRLLVSNRIDLFPKFRQSLSHSSDLCVITKFQIKKYFCSNKDKKNDSNQSQEEPQQTESIRKKVSLFLNRSQKWYAEQIIALFSWYRLEIIFRH